MKPSDINLALNAGYVYFYIQAVEIDRAILNLQEIINKNQWELTLWDFEKQVYDKGTIIPFITDAKPNSVCICKNLNWFLEDKTTREINYQLVTFFQNHLSEFEAQETRKSIIIIGSEDFENAIPNDLKKDFMCLEFEPPSVAEIETYLQSIIDSASDNQNFKKPSKQVADDIIESCKGLTRKSIMNALAYSLIKNKGVFVPSDIANLRAQEIESTVGLKVGKYSVPELQGYENIKEFVSKSINSPLSKGILIIGPPGTGKTHFCKSISSMCNKIMIEAELAEMQGSGLYGQAEAAWSNMIKTVKSIGNAILFIDEIEKGLAATSKFAATDSTGKRSASLLLKFMSEPRPGIYIIATCNSISDMPVEYLRSERWDAIFYLGLPNQIELEKIFKYYINEYNIKKEDFDIKKMVGWSGAEIKTVCRIAKMLNSTLENASRFVIPISRTMEKQIKDLEVWARDRAIPASVAIDNKGKRSVVL